MNGEVAVHSNQRDMPMDALKGVGIVLVVLGHSYYLPEVIHQYIYSFHMPLFFMISGYLTRGETYEEHSFLEIVLKKAKAYMLPYFLFLGINTIFSTFWNVWTNGVPYALKQIPQYIGWGLYCYADMEHMPNCSPIWFLFCLFIASTIFCYIQRHQKCSIWLGLFGLLVGSVLAYTVDWATPFRMATVPMAVAFMVCGQLLKRYETKVRPVWAIGLFLIGSIAGLMPQNSVEMSYNSYENIPLFLVSSLFISTALICGRKWVLGKWSKGLAYFGRNTMVFVGLNYWARSVALELYYIIPGLYQNNVWLGGYLFLTTMLILVVAVEVSRRFPVRRNRRKGEVL